MRVFPRLDGDAERARLEAQPEPEPVPESAWFPEGMVELPSDAMLGTPLPPPTLAEAESIGKEDCRLGFHAWLPWLQLPGGTYLTICCRCRARETYP